MSQSVEGGGGGAELGEGKAEALAGFTPDPSASSLVEEGLTEEGLGWSLGAQTELLEALWGGAGEEAQLEAARVFASVMGRVRDGSPWGRAYEDLSEWSRRKTAELGPSPEDQGYFPDWTREAAIPLLYDLLRRPAETAAGLEVVRCALRVLTCPTAKYRHLPRLRNMSAEEAELVVAAMDLPHQPGKPEQRHLFYRMGPLTAMPEELAPRMAARIVRNWHQEHRNGSPYWKWDTWAGAEWLVPQMGGPHGRLLFRLGAHYSLPNTILRSIRAGENIGGLPACLDESQRSVWEVDVVRRQLNDAGVPEALHHYHNACYRRNQDRSNSRDLLAALAPRPSHSRLPALIRFPNDC